MSPLDGMLHCSKFTAWLQWLSKMLHGHCLDFALAATASKHLLDWQEGSHELNQHNQRISRMYRIPLQISTDWLWDHISDITLTESCSVATLPHFWLRLCKFESFSSWYVHHSRRWRCRNHGLPNCIQHETYQLCVLCLCHIFGPHSSRELFLQGIEINSKSE